MGKRQIGVTNQATTPRIHSAEPRAWQGQEARLQPAEASGAAESLLGSGDQPLAYSPGLELVLSRGWADAGLPPGSLVDRRQLAPSTALRMCPSLATDPWPQTIPTAHLVSGTVPPPLGAPVRRAAVWGVSGAFFVRIGKSQAFAVFD